MDNLVMHTTLPAVNDWLTPSAAVPVPPENPSQFDGDRQAFLLGTITAQNKDGIDALLALAKGLFVLAAGRAQTDIEPIVFAQVPNTPRATIKVVCTDTRSALLKLAIAMQEVGYDSVEVL